MLTQERLKEVLHYNPLTGNFTWKVRTGQRIKIGDIAGYTNSDGYIQISLDGKKYQAHRLAWLYVTGELPPKQIDHINHDKADNRIANLRCTNQAENCKNATKRKDNNSGVMGVSWYKDRQKWVVNIRVNGKRLHLGYTTDFDIAIAMRKAAERKYGFHKNHGSEK